MEVFSKQHEVDMIEDHAPDTCLHHYLTAKENGRLGARLVA